MGILLSQAISEDLVPIDFNDLYCILTGGTGCGELVPGKYYLVENFRTSYFLAGTPGVFRDNPAIKADYDTTCPTDPLTQELPTDVISRFDVGTDRGHRVLFGISAATITPSAVPVVTDMFFGGVEPLVVLALTANTISSQAWSQLFPLDILHWDPLAYYDVGTSNKEYYMGRITYREDTVRGISAPYDWRSVKFMRYTRTSELKSQVWYAAEDYGSAVPLFEVGEISNPYPVYGGTEALSPFYQNARYTFGNAVITSGSDSFSDPIGFRNVRIGKYATKELWQRKEMSNIVFFTPQNLGAGQNEDENDTVCENVTFGQYCSRMSIESTGMKNVDFGNWCSENIISAKLKDSKIGDSFSQNLFEGEDPAPGTPGGAWVFESNEVGANFKNNWFHGGGSTPPINEFVSNRVGSDFVHNNVQNRVYGSEFAPGFYSNFIKNYFISNRIMRPVSNVAFKLQLIDSASFVSGFDPTYIGVLSLENQYIDQFTSTFSAGVVFDGVSALHSTHITVQSPAGNPAYTLDLSGFDIVGTVYVKAYDSTSPTSSVPNISVPHQLQWVINGPQHALTLVPVKSSGLVGNPLAAPLHYVLRLVSQSTSEVIGDDVLSLATEFLDLDSEFNDWVRVDRRRYLLPDSFASGAAWYQITGQNNYGVGTTLPNPV